MADHAATEQMIDALIDGDRSWFHDDLPPEVGAPLVEVRPYWAHLIAAIPAALLAAVAAERNRHADDTCTTCLLPEDHPLRDSLDRLHGRAVTHAEAQAMCTALCPDRSGERHRTDDQPVLFEDELWADSDPGKGQLLFGNRVPAWPAGTRLRVVLAADPDTQDHTDG